MPKASPQAGREKGKGRERQAVFVFSSYTQIINRDKNARLQSLINADVIF